MTALMVHALLSYLSIVANQVHYETIVTVTAMSKTL